MIIAVIITAAVIFGIMVLVFSTEKPYYVAILDISKIENDTKINQVDFRDAKGEIIEVGCITGLRPNSDNYSESEISLFFKCNPVLLLILISVITVGVAIGFIIWRIRK